MAVIVQPTVRRVVLSVLLGSLAFTPAHSSSVAKVTSWARTPFQYVVVDQNIRDVIREMFAAASVPVEIADSVRGHIHSRWPDHTVGEFLDHLTQSNGLAWYFDGSVMHICKSSDVDTKNVPAHGVELAALSDRMILAGASDNRFKVLPGNAADTFRVSGPPAYIATVEQSIAAISGGAPLVAGASNQTVTVFNGSDAPKISVFSSPNL